MWFTPDVWDRSGAVGGPADSARTSLHSKIFTTSTRAVRTQVYYCDWYAVYVLIRLCVLGMASMDSDHRRPLLKYIVG